uniref:Uncharacterized protein n=1 Tax=Rhizophora mucronata TaxID=61149 RepID=A0A2P2PZZ2_RHIMU
MAILTSDRSHISSNRIGNLYWKSHNPVISYAQCQHSVPLCSTKWLIYHYHFRVHHIIKIL